MSLLSLASAHRHLAWLERRGVMFGANVGLSHAASMGAGLVAAKSLPAGEVLVSIPPAVWKPFSAEEASRTEACAEAVAAHAASLGAGVSFSDAALLAARLARFVTMSGDGQDSDDSGDGNIAYLASLPPPDVPLLWPAPLRAALLRGTSAGIAAESQVALSDGVHGVMMQHAGDAAPSQAAFRWAQAILLSRAHSGDGKPLALVPGLDLLNHGGRAAGACVHYRDHAFELVATRAHAKGDPIEIDYGTSASHRLLRLYGFVPRRGGHEEQSGEEAAAEAAAQTAVEVGEEVIVPLLPSAAELSGAPDAVLQEVAAIRDSLAACGISGSSLRLRLGDDGRFALPQIGGAGQEASTALRVLLSAIDTQKRRQQQGFAACQAIQAAPGRGTSDEAARRRARLCLQLHTREAALLEAAWTQLQDDYLS